jgi:hypothetical protein
LQNGGETWIAGSSRIKGKALIALSFLEPDAFGCKATGLFLRGGGITFYFQAAALFP